MFTDFTILLRILGSEFLVDFYMKVGDHEVIFLGIKFHSNPNNYEWSVIITLTVVHLKISIEVNFGRLSKELVHEIFK